jgi:predicted RNase H-like nuclease (RuvC/YqgF family)
MEHKRMTLIKAPNINYDDTPVKPSHYKTGGMEPYEYMQMKMTKEQLEGFYLGNVIKYVSRYQYKNGLEDMKKAEWYRRSLLSRWRERMMQECEHGNTYHCQSCEIKQLNYVIEEMKAEVERLQAEKNDLSVNVLISVDAHKDEIERRRKIQTELKESQQKVERLEKGIKNTLDKFNPHVRKWEFVQRVIKELEQALETEGKESDKR